MGLRPWRDRDGRCLGHQTAGTTAILSSHRSMASRSSPSRRSSSPGKCPCSFTVTAIVTRYRMVPLSHLSTTVSRFTQCVGLSLAMCMVVSFPLCAAPEAAAAPGMPGDGVYFTGPVLGGFGGRPVDGFFVHDLPVSVRVRYSEVHRWGVLEHGHDLFFGGIGIPGLDANGAAKLHTMGHCDSILWHTSAPVMGGSEAPWVVVLYKYC